MTPAGLFAVVSAFLPATTLGAAESHDVEGAHAGSSEELLQSSITWGEFQENDCVSIWPGKREYSAVLYGIPSGQSWEDTCAETGAVINGYEFDAPDRCVTTWFNVWGEFDVPDDSCEPNWAALVGTEYYTHQDDGCISSGEYAGLHKYASRLWNIVGSWEDTCASMPMTIGGHTYASPHECVHTGDAMWGEWYVPDSKCESNPASYARGAEDSLVNSGDLSGYIDLHGHPMSSLGFGGVVFHGEPYGDPATALGDCPSGTGDHSGGHSRVEGIITDDILGAVLNTASHESTGHDTYPMWPKFNSPTHQTMYYEWVKRAYEGGMRATVALAVNGDFMYGATDNGLPDIVKGIAIASDPDYSLDDMETLHRQTQAVYDMEAYIDAQNNGDGWYKVVTSAAQARTVIEAGKLAVILGTEVDYPLGCTPTEPCTTTEIDAGVDELYDLGIRFVFPIHLKTNDFGGAALYNILGSGDKYDCKHYSQDCNTLGLTDNGKHFMEELMKRGMVIELGHMSALAMAGALDLVEEHQYPGVVTGHTGVYDMVNLGARHEANPPGSALKRIIDVGGMIGLIAGQGSLEEVSEWVPQDGTTRIPHGCGGTSQTFAQSYLYLKDLIGAEAHEGKISIGTDFNGFATMPGPRFGDDACHGGDSDLAQPTSTQVQYPFTIDPDLIRTPSQPTSGSVQLDQYTFGQRTFDYNTDGAAHIGLLPDFFEDLRQQGMKRSDLEPVYRSAGYFADMWEAAEQRSAALSGSTPNPIFEDPTLLLVAAAALVAAGFEIRRQLRAVALTKLQTNSRYKSCDTDAEAFRKINDIEQGACA